jgi:CshA-type fibril repeat protein
MTAVHRPQCDRPGSLLIAFAIFVAVGGLAVCSPAQAVALPGTPGKPTAIAGDTQAVVTVVPPTSGGPVTGYIVQMVDDINFWCQPLTNQTSCAVTGLANGTVYRFRSMATGTGDPSGWSVPSNPVTPKAIGTPTIPGPTTPTSSPSVPSPATVTLVAGVSSLTATWSPVTGATGYTATASPSGVNCLVAGTSCVLGTIARTSTTVTVVAHSAAGDSVASVASNAVVPRSPTIPTALPTSATPVLTTEAGPIGLAAPGQPILLVGTGFLPFSSVRAGLYSTAVDLGESVTNAAGAFTLRALLPDDLTSGAHTLLASGVDPDGGTRMISLPITVAATEAGSHGDDGVTQTGRLPIPTGGAVTLLDDNDGRTTSVTVAGGVYALNPVNGVVSFTPATWFSGIAPPARYRISDAVGTQVTGTYTAVVAATAAASAPRLKLAKRIVSTVASSAEASLSCTIARGAIARCVVTATAVVDGEKTVVGYGLTTPSLTQNRRSVVVGVVLNEVGRYLPARPGGTRMTFAAELMQRDQAGSRSTSASTVVEAKRYRLHRSIAFGHNSSTVTTTGAAYLKQANSKLQDGIKITCTGHADSRERKPTALATRRAQRSCAVIAKGLGADVSSSAQVDKHPTGDDNTSAGRAKNRRVTVTVTN